MRLTEQLYWLAHGIVIAVRRRGISGTLSVLADGLVVAVEVEASGDQDLVATWETVVPDVVAHLGSMDGYVSSRFQMAEERRRRTRAGEEWGPTPEARQACVRTILRQGLVEIRHAARSGNIDLVVALADLLHSLPTASGTDDALRLWFEQDLLGAVADADHEVLPLLVGWQQLCSAAMEEPPF